VIGASLSLVTVLAAALALVLAARRWAASDVGPPRRGQWSATAMIAALIVQLGFAERTGAHLLLTATVIVLAVTVAVSARRAA
jgi:hypothetical protein